MSFTLRSSPMVLRLKANTNCLRKSRGTLHASARSYFFREHVLEGDKSFSEKFVLYDDGEEPAQSMISPKLIPSNRTSKE